MTMTFADRIDSKLSMVLGNDFDISTADDASIVLAVVKMDISVDMDAESVTARFYGFSVGGSAYNADMVKQNGGNAAVARELAINGVPERIVATTVIDYNGDNAADIGKALVALRDIMKEFENGVTA